MGTHLDERYGDRYFAVGFGEGQFGDVDERQRLPDAFDGLVFVADTSRARPIERD